jgi:hypothetical protein
VSKFDTIDSSKLETFFQRLSVVETINLKTKTKKHINKNFICCVVMEVTTTMNSINNNGRCEDLCRFLIFRLFSLDTKQKVKKKLSSKWNASICWNFIEELKKKNALCKVLFDYTRKMDSGLYVQIITQIQHRSRCSQRKLVSDQRPRNPFCTSHWVHSRSQNKSTLGYQLCSSTLQLPRHKICFGSFTQRLKKLVQTL